MNIKKWSRRQLANISLALSNVEKNSLGQNTNNDISSNDETGQSERQGMLSDDLIKGRLSIEVTTLRARLYKILQESNNYAYSSGDRGYKINNNINSKVKGEPSDDYKVEMVVSNDIISSELSNDNINEIDNKPEVPILITRSILPKFKLESYTTKLYIKDINPEEKLLEFFISKYVDVKDKKTCFLIKDIERAITNPRSSDLLDIDSVGFITNNTLGINDFLQFKYEILNFYKIVEFNGHYVIKFKCKPIINGVNIVDKYIDTELDKRYENKEQKGDTIYYY